jgi:hypothetical protein
MAVGSHQLKLSECGNVVGATVGTAQCKLAADCRGSAIQTKLGDFHCGIVSVNLSPASPTYNIEGPETITFVFSEVGSLFLSKIGNDYQFFDWSEDVGYFSLSANQDYTCLTTVYEGQSTGTLTGIFNDGFNYSTNKTQTAAIEIGTIPV